MAPPPVKKTKATTKTLAKTRKATQTRMEKTPHQTGQNEAQENKLPADESKGVTGSPDDNGVAITLGGRMDTPLSPPTTHKRHVQDDDGSSPPLKRAQLNKTNLDTDGSTSEGGNSAQRELGANTDTAKQPAAQPSRCLLKEPVTAVRDLNPQLPTPWVFIGRILARNPVQSFSTWRAKGRLFEIYISDENGDIIRATVFNEGVDKFFAMVTPGSIFSFSFGRIKTANTKFALLNSPVEISFGPDAVIVPVNDNTMILPEPSFRNTPLADLPSQQSTAEPTVCGVIVDTGPERSITTRKGTETTKREFLLVDDSDAEILCTAWGQTAMEIDASLKGRVILITRGQISDYMAVRSLNIGVGSIVLHEPALSRSAELKTWFATVTPGHQFTSLHG